MFFSKANNTEVLDLENKIQELNAKLLTSESKNQDFLNKFHKDLEETIKQHEFVNKQHGLLGSMVNKLLREYDNMENSTIQSDSVSEKVLEEGQNLLTSSSKMVEAANQGKESMDKLLNLIGSLKDQSSENTTSINSLGERSREIEDIISFIQSVSDQTNMLALNASIESARAGEAGRGFSVVANEIRKLAENTKDSALNIQNLTKNIQDEVANAVANNQTSIDLINNGHQEVVNSFDQVNLLLTIVNNVQEIIMGLMASIEDQRALSQDVISNFHRSRSMFDEIKDTLVSHIKEADVVTKNLNKFTNF